MGQVLSLPLSTSNLLIFGFPWIGQTENLYQWRLIYVDARNKDNNELTICPNCKKHYTPELGERKHLEMCIQDEFPNATPVQREQLVSGLCSDLCWNAYLGF